MFKIPTKPSLDTIYSHTHTHIYIYIYIYIYVCVCVCARARAQANMITYAEGVTYLLSMDPLSSVLQAKNGLLEFVLWNRSSNTLFEIEYFFRM